MSLHTAGSRLAVSKPLYSQVRDMVLDRIRSGTWKRGETLPNEFTLASEFGVSIGTVRRAVAELEATGIVERKQGRGTFVNGLGDDLADRFCPLRSRSGERSQLTYRVLGLSKRPASAGEMSRLRNARQPEVVELRQALLAAGRPVGIEISTFPSNVCAPTEQDLAGGRPLYSVLGDAGIVISRAEETIRATPADRATAELLGVEADTPVLTVSRIAYSLDDQPVELRTSHFVTEEFDYVHCLA